MTESTDSWFSKRIEGQLKELSSESPDLSRAALVFVSIFTLIVLYFAVHQIWATGFFSDKFGVLEMLFLYGSLFEWIIVGALEVFGRKNLSRDIDAFGGIIFVTTGGIWLFVIFPFKFVYFGDVLPEFLRFLLSWISNDIARFVLVLWIIVNGVASVYYGILRVFVRKKLSKIKN